VTTPSIRVFYDIGILARLRACGVRESGLARAARELLNALLADRRVDVAVVSCEAPFSALRVCDEAGWSHRFAAPGGVPGRLLLRLVLHLEDVIGCLSSSRHGLARPLRSLLFRVAHLLKRIPLAPLTSKLLKDGDIYQSSFLSLPDPEINTGRCRKFLYLHDVIAIRHPDWFDKESTEELQRIVASVTPDSWVIANSEFTRLDFIDLTDFPPARVKVAPLAADRQRFFPCHAAQVHARLRQHIGLGPNQPFILSVCTIEPRKNLDKVLKAWQMARLKHGIDNLALVLAGQIGWHQEAFAACLDSFGEDRHHIFTPGYMADEDLAPLYSSALAFLYLSRYEGFGLPPLEAMQCGVPVIASNRTSIPEVVGDSAILVDPDDVETIAGAIRDLHDDPVKAANLGRSGVERSSLFSWEKCAADCIDAYIGAIETNRREP
jgi:glycosyltransferase involved in cell wall biosynthesis